MVAAGVIWKFMYDYKPPGAAPDRHAERGDRRRRRSARSRGSRSTTFSAQHVRLIVVMAWMWTGFAMVIISAALKGINPELLEAARVDGATEWQVFRRIVFPLLRADPRRRLDHDDHHGAQDVRHRLHDDRAATTTPTSSPT